MSTLQMLDVFIGIIFIYLLLSFICSAISEIMEGILKKRGSDLHRGICELIQATPENKLLKKSNFPDQPDKVQVLFNKLPGKVIVLSPDSLRVLVPSVNTTQDSTPVRLALLVEQDTVYTANSLTVKRKFTSQTKQPPVREVTDGNPRADGVADWQDTSLPDVTPKPDPNQGKTKPDYPCTSGEPAKLNKPKPKVLKPQSSKLKSKPNNQKSEEKPDPYSYSTRPTVNIYKLVKVKSNVIANLRRDGTKNLQITDQNSSAYDLDNVRVEIEYLSKNGKPVAIENLNFANMRAHTSQTLAAPDNEKGKKVNFKIVAIDSKQLY